MIPALDPDPESDFQPFGNSKSRFGSSKKWNRNTSNSDWNERVAACLMRNLWPLFFLLRSIKRTDLTHSRAGSFVSRKDIFINQSGAMAAAIGASYT